MKKRILAGLLATLLCAALSGCGGGSENGSTPGAQSSSGSASPTATATSITVGIAQDLDESLDPHLTVSAGTREVMFNVFEGLVKPTPDGDLIDAVAKSHEVSDGGTVYTFTLRDGVKFHNGAAVTADDVVWSIQRCADTGKGTAPLVEAFSNIRSVEATDEKTVVITLGVSDNEFLAALTTAILPAYSDQQSTAPVGTGPFKFVSRTIGDSIVLEQFDDYWGEKPSLETVTFKIFESGDALVLALQSGAVDLCAHLTPTQAAQLGDSFTVLDGTMNLVQALYLNNAVKPLNDVRVRQALCYAVDKQQVIDLASDGTGKALGSSMYPAFTKYFDDSLTNYYTQNVEKAKSLLAEAGYPNGFDLTITVPSNYQPHIDTAQVLVEQLKAVGVNAEIELVDWNTWVSRVYTDREYQSTVVGVDASSMTARAMLERFTSTYGKNFINYNNADYDALFQEAQLVTAANDGQEQTALYKQMERNLTENAANVYLQDLGDLVAIRSDLTGYQFYPIYVMDLSGVKAG